MKGRNKQLGLMGEQAAREYLENMGYRIAALNYRGPSGEIDIIAWDGDIIAFVEVKTRTGDLFGTPAEAVTKKKRERIISTSLYYMYEHDLDDIQMRYDIIEVTIAGGKPAINHIDNAFY